MLQQHDVPPPVQPVVPQRYTCPFPGCTRSFRDFWRLKVHYRAPPSARGSGVERGHGQELPFCPLCNLDLRDVKYHKCSAAPGASAGTGKRHNGGTRASLHQPQQYMLPRPGVPHGPIALPTGNLPYHAAEPEGGFAWQRPLPPHAGLPHIGPPAMQQPQHQGMMQQGPGMASGFNPSGMMPPQQQQQQQLQPMPAHTADGLTPRAAAAAAAGIPMLQQPQHQGSGDHSQQQQWWLNQPPSPPPLEPQQQHWAMQAVSQQLPVPAPAGTLPLQQQQFQQQQPFQQQQMHQQLQPGPYQQQQQYLPAQHPQQHQQQHQQQPQPGDYHHLPQHPQHQFMQPRLSSSGSGVPGLPAGLPSPAGRAFPAATGRDQQQLGVASRGADAWQHQQHQQQQLSHGGQLVALPAVSPSAAAAAAAAAGMRDGSTFPGAPVASSCWPQMDSHKPLNVHALPAPGGSGAWQQYGSVAGDAHHQQPGSFVPAEPGGGLLQFDPLQSASSAATGVRAPVMAPVVGAAAAGACAPEPALPGQEHAAIFDSVIQQFTADLAALRAEIISSGNKPQPAAHAAAAHSPDLAAAANQAASSSNSSPRHHPGLAHQGSGAYSSPAAAAGDAALAAAAGAAGPEESCALAGSKRSSAELNDGADDSEQGRDTIPASKRPACCSPGSGAGAAAGPVQPPGVPGRTAWTDTPPPPEAPAALLELAAHVEGLTGGGPAAAVAGSRQAGAPGSAAGSGGSSPASSVCEAAAGAAAGSTQDVHAAKVSSLIAAAMQSAVGLGLPDPRALMPRLLDVLNEHISALSEIHDAEGAISPQGSQPKAAAEVTDTPLVARSGAPGNAATAEAAAAAAAASGSVSQQQAAQAAKQEDCLLEQQQQEEMPPLMAVSMPLQQQLPWEQPLDVAAASGHCFFDHIDAAYAAADGLLLSALPPQAVAADR